jgi:hypothetical protein
VERYYSRLNAILMGWTRQLDALDDAVSFLLASERQARITDPRVVAGLQDAARIQARELRDWLERARATGQQVLGYGAASRSVTLLHLARVDGPCSRRWRDASPAQQGLRMPGTSIPVISPDELVGRHPDAVLLFVPDLLTEVRTSYPQIEAAAGRWVPAGVIQGD